MRKILMFGTMLGVASAALAFGGIFNHGNKSTTYKGGVDAIGVHFGGEKSSDSKDIPGEVCAEGILKDRFGHCNVCENGNVYLSYMDNPCDTETEDGGECVKNDDCAENEWCNIGADCDHTYSVSCVPITMQNKWVEWELNPKIYTLSNGETFLYSGEGSSFDWWGADNWCRANGRKMVSIEDLDIVCSDDECVWSNPKILELFADGMATWTTTLQLYGNSCPIDGDALCVADWDGVDEAFSNPMNDNALPVLCK